MVFMSFVFVWFQWVWRGLKMASRFSDGNPSDDQSPVGAEPANIRLIGACRDFNPIGESAVKQVTRNERLQIEIGIHPDGGLVSFAHGR